MDRVCRWCRGCVLVVVVLAGQLVGASKRSGFRRRRDRVVGRVASSLAFVFALVCGWAVLAPAAASATVSVAESAAAGPVVVVNSTGDGAWDGTPGVCETATGNGVCTLRAAIGLADANSGIVIGFHISGAGVHTIAPGSPLPGLTAPMTIDGSTQPGYAGPPLIELSGASAGVAHGLELVGGSSGSAIRGLDIVNWSGSGIVIFTNGNTVAGNFIGTDPTGSSPAGNGTQGVLIFGGSGNTVGGTLASDRNVISGNGDHGVQIQRPTQSSLTPATGNVVEGNYVGTNATGDAPIANALDGISLVWGAQGNTIGGSVPGAGNVVSGNGRIGISVFDISASNLIEGNYIGTNAAGTRALGGNPECGIALISASNTVGGTSVGARNVISGNSGGCGLTIGGQSNTIEGNYIGTNAAGTAALGNGTGLSDVPAGVAIQSSNNQVGGTAVGAGNVISGNDEPGVWFDTTGATGNVVQGNDIGTDTTTTHAIGNSGDGVLLTGGASGNTIGGTAPGDANTIAHNSANGVEISGGTGDAIESNAIFANSGLGIALTSGGNGNEPAPTVLSALSSGPSTTISGTAATDRRIEVFANPSCSHAEGAVFLGSTVSSTGNWSLTVPAVAIGSGITATATNLVSDNTSPFSTCQANPLPRPLITSISPKSGSIKGGTTVRIVGQYLSGTAVSFGSRPVIRFTVNSPTQITAVSPRRSAPGVVGVSVTTGGGKSAAVAADRFTYTACVVPKLKGETLRNARKALKRADCQLGKVKPQGQTTGHIKTQSPKAGAVLAPGRKVQVKLARNPSKPPKPRLRSRLG